MTDIYSRTLPLPMGFRVTFSWAQPGGLAVQWEPDVPDIRSTRHRRKFFEAYQAARRDFMQDVATSLGGSVMVVDLTGESEVIRPGVRH